MMHVSTSRTTTIVFLFTMMMACRTRHDLTNRCQAQASSGNNPDLPHMILSSASESAGPKRSKPLGSATWHFFCYQPSIPISLPCHSPRVMAYSMKPFVNCYKYRLSHIVPS
jgi:hypothetical protein